MINIFYENLPTTITANGTNYKIVTDFREWLRFADMIEDNSLTVYEKISLLSNWIYDVPKTLTQEIISSVFSFYRADELEPLNNGNEYDDDSVKTPPLLNWRIDAKYIIGDFLKHYGIDLLSAEMHWWKFQCLLISLPDSSNVQKRIAYRGADLSKIKNRSERDRIAKIQRQLSIPFEISDEDIGNILGGDL